MLFLHELHKVMGARLFDFEDAYRTGWMPTLARGDDARLLWYANQAMGTGASYNVVTITAIKDGAAWERMALRIQGGDLQTWMREVDTLRHELTGKLLLPLAWSPLKEVNLREVPVGGAEHDPELFMEDTGWPHAPLDDYITGLKELYLPMITQAREHRILELQAMFQVAHGTHQRREIVFWQKVIDHQALLRMIERPARRQDVKPGTYMLDALKYRDQWQSKLLRSASWSPLS
ncbi:MAG TPA: hypothetical protein VGH29_01230 [Candidatus Binataceae bacterium]